MEFKTVIESYKIKSVEPIFMSTEKQQLKYREKVFYIPFLLRSGQVISNLLTDSNTHFDTTRANIEFSGTEAIGAPVKEGRPAQMMPCTN